MADPTARDAIKAVDDPDVRKSISTLPPAAGYVLAETLVKPDEMRSRDSRLLTMSGWRLLLRLRGRALL